MNRYYKIVENEQVISIGTNIGLGEEITEEEYLALEAEFDANAPEPEEPEPLYTLDEASAIIAEEVLSNE